MDDCFINMSDNMFFLNTGHRNSRSPGFKIIQSTMPAFTRFLLHHSQTTKIAKNNKSLYISILSVIAYDKGSFSLSYHGHLAALQATKIMHNPMG